MDAKAFFDLTAQMRDAQKAYSSTPSGYYRQRQDYLMQSKRLEAQIDAEIKRVKEIMEREKWNRENPTFPGYDVELLNKAGQ